MQQKQWCLVLSDVTQRDMCYYLSTMNLLLKNCLKNKLLLHIDIKVSPLRSLNQGDFGDALQPRLKQHENTFLLLEYFDLWLQLASLSVP